MELLSNSDTKKNAYHEWCDICYIFTCPVGSMTK
jgi:hypothetical protein